MRPKISIIMPSYNVVEYIGVCLESVLNQNLKDVEIICVDADSDDGTLDILKKSATEDDRIKLVLSDAKSYGSQVNYGIDISSGEYIAILETDDYVTSSMYEKLYNTSVKYSLDYCKMNWQYFCQVRKGYYYCENRILSEKNQYERIIVPSDDKLIALEDGTIWSGIYNRDFLVKNNIRLNETPGAAYQDIGFLMQVYEKARRAMYNDETGYCYRYNRPGASSWNRNALMYVINEWDYLEKLGIVSERVLSRLCAAVLCETNKLIRAEKFNLNSESIAPYLGIVKEKLNRIEKDGWLPKEDDYTNRVRDMLNDFPEHVSVIKTQHDKEMIIRHQLDDFLGESECIIVGSGSYGKTLFYAVGMEYDKISCYCDNSTEKIGSNIGPHSILSINDAILKYPNRKFVIANKNCADEIEKQLVELGISSTDIVRFTGKAIE